MTQLNNVIKNAMKTFIKLNARNILKKNKTIITFNWGNTKMQKMQK